MKSTFVLGAGASCHAGYPLATELGPGLEAWLAGAITTTAEQLYGPTINGLHELYGSLANLEQILSELDANPINSRARRLSDSERKYAFRAVRILIPEFFRQIRYGAAKLYAELACNHIKPGDTIITFNYDVALDRELRRAGLWNTNNGYCFALDVSSMSNSPVKILKLHGSVNWLQVAFGGMSGFFQGGPTAFGSRPIILPHEFEFLECAGDVRDPLAPASSNFGGIPAIITPTLNKRFYDHTSGGIELADFWNGLWGMAANVLASSDRVVVIGYSMPPADQRAQDLLLTSTNPRATVAIYCGKDSSRIGKTFSDQGFRSVEAGEGCFEDFLEKS